MGVTQLLDLPPELIVEVLTHVDSPDLCNICSTCQKLKELGRLDSVWRARCIKEYGRKSVAGWDGSCYELYTKLLYKYGKTLGLWKRNFYPYGGIVLIKYYAGRIIAQEYFAPHYPFIKNELRVKDLFSISISKKGGVELACLKGYKGHACTVAAVSDTDWLDNEKGETGLLYECCDKKCHKHPVSFAEKAREWLEEEIGPAGPLMYHNCYLHRGEVYLKFCFSYRLQPLVIPQPETDVPIQPGLFKGTYSAHGIEIMSVEYRKNKKELHLIKVTGDPNIPATKVSIIADLQRPMILNLDQQDDTNTLMSIDTPDLPDDLETHKQPFCVPDNCVDRGIVNENLPKTCEFRCSAKGQIAAHGYRSPSMSSAHWMVFDESTFGVLWLELRAFSMYSRVTETFDS